MEKFENIEMNQELCRSFNSFVPFRFLHIKKVRADHFHGSLGLLFYFFYSPYKF